MPTFSSFLTVNLYVSIMYILFKLVKEFTNEALIEIYDWDYGYLYMLIEIDYCLLLKMCKHFQA